MNTHAGIGDSWNPILVKEVRAGLRGRVFRILFQVVALGAVLVSMLVLSSLDPARDANVGKEFLQPVYLMLCIALLGIVPLSAYFSMGGEWEENTFDLLSISDLRPRHIVFGKLFSAGVEATLYFSAFAPLLVFAFLLRGIDIVALITLLSLTYVASFAASAIALAFSSLARVRLARLLVLCVVAAACVGLIALAANLSETFVLRSWGPSSGFGWRNVCATLAFVLAGLFGGTTVACERLAHPEENHSTGPRVLVTGLLVLWLSSWAWVAHLNPGNLNWAAEPLMVGLLLAGIAHVFFLTEREDMTRRTARGVPRRRLAAMLAAPFFPGGGRAVLLFGLHAALAVATMAWILAWNAGATTFEEGIRRAPLRVGLFAAHLFCYIASISWIMHRHADRPLVRWLTRLAIPGVIILLICVPAFAVYLLGGSRFPEFEHGWNPFIALSRGGTYVFRFATLVTAIALVSGLLNLGRVVRGIREVLGASAHNRESEKQD